MKLKTCLLGCAAALAVTCTPGGAWAQAAPTTPTTVDQPSPAPAPATEVGEIVVTAQRRAENLQRVPIVITAVSGQQLAAAGVTSLPNLQTIAPGLNVRTTAGGVFQPSLRGIGTSSNVVENPVALYIDGVYLPQQREGNRELPDVEQVAVLKGPQGTLFGRNATGGVIQITTRRPPGARRRRARAAAGPGAAPRAGRPASRPTSRPKATAMAATSPPGTARSRSRTRWACGASCCSSPTRRRPCC